MTAKQSYLWGGKGVKLSQGLMGKPKVIYQEMVFDFLRKVPDTLSLLGSPLHQGKGKAPITNLLSHLTCFLCNEILPCTLVFTTWALQLHHAFCACGSLTWGRQLGDQLGTPRANLRTHSYPLSLSKTPWVGTGQPVGLKSIWMVATPILWLGYRSRHFGKPRPDQ